MRKHACEAAGLMKALSNENRLIVLCALAEGELSVGQLHERVD
jgi:DNA-binding transcriptional ArsR family regulator